jgi:hypothetical protein
LIPIYHTGYNLMFIYVLIEYLNCSHDDADDARKILTPFNKVDRRITGLTPRTWFVASLIGYTMSREMNNLALHIISFMGRCKECRKQKQKKQERQKTSINDDDESSKKKKNRARR